MDNNTYLQLGIHGIADNKEFNVALDSPIKTIKRVKLAKFIRNQCSLSGRDFAKSIGVSPATITKWLYTDTMPSMRIVRSIATKYGITVDDVDKLFEVA